MDLRIVKTKKSIREAFLQMRKTTSLEKLKVRDLCRIALINKSTFYNHYEDIFALSEELENEVLQQVIADFAYKDCLFTNPLKFLSNVPQAMDSQKELITLLFSDRRDVLFSKLESLLRTYYSQPNSTAKDDVRLAFLIGGTMYAMQALTNEGKVIERDITAYTAELIQKL